MYQFFKSPQGNELHIQSKEKYKGTEQEMKGTGCGALWPQQKNTIPRTSCVKWYLAEQRGFEPPERY